MVDWRAVGPRAVLVVVLLVVNVALVGAMATSATAYGPYNPEWDGVSELRSTAPAPTTAIETTAYADFGAGTTAFVLAPRSQYDTADAARVRQFVRRGGTLVVAAESDRVDDLLGALGADVRVGDRPLRDEQSNYRGPSLPVATNVSGHPLVAGVESLTLNEGGTVRPANETVLLSTAPTAYVDSNRNGTFDADESVGSFPVAAVEPLGDGRVVLVGDASVFTNGLADRDGNRAFVRALTDGANATLFDQSHAGPLPPLPYALVVLRTTPLAQFGLAVGAFGLLGFLAVGGPGRLRRRVRSLRDSGPDPSAVRLSEDDVAAYLGARHPAWDDDRVRRVTKAIIRRRGEPEDDD